MIISNKPYINLKLSQYEGIEPFFYDKINLDWCNDLLKNIEIIKNEFLVVFNERKALEESTKKITLDHHKGWNQIELITYGLQKEKNIKLFPQTFDIIKNIKNISTCYFSILKPNTQIKPHIGDTDAYYRFHFGLIVPGGLPNCGIQVGPEKRAWKENDYIVFNDVHKHTAWNNTTENRVVLIIDVLREFEDISRQEVEAQVLTALTFSRLTNYFVVIFEIMPKFLIRLMLFFIKAIFKLKLATQKHRID
ncbi:MAG: aspartyl/asparaginyl beta-hydroxylase domain-containing protein [Flavobacteriales bacterium]